MKVVGLCERHDCCFLSLICVTEGKMWWPLDVFVSVALRHGANAALRSLTV